MTGTDGRNLANGRVIPNEHCCDQPYVVQTDGGARRQYGWGRFGPGLGDVSGAGQVRLAATLRGRVERLRVYARPLSTSEAVANCRAEGR